MANEQKEYMEQAKADITARLEEYQKRREECEQIRERIREKKGDIKHLKKLTFDSIVQHDLTIIEQVDRAVEAINGLIGYYTQLVVKREEAERYVVDLLEQVQNADGRTVLRLHYIDGVSYQKIPALLGMGERTMWRKHQIAIDELCAITNAQ